MADRVLLVVGLKREAALLASPGVDTLVGGGSGAVLRPALDAALKRKRPRAVVSVGLAGALSPTLAVGDWIVAESVVDGERHWPAHPGLVQALVAAGSRDGGAPPRLGALAGSDTMVVEPAGKAGLHAQSGALAVDMESHHAARFAAEHGLPFAAIRVISDDAGRALPAAAQAGMRTDGGVDVLAVVGQLARDPGQLPALLRTGREAEVAFRRLRLLGRHHLLGRLGVGDPDLGQLLLDVV